MSLFLRRPPRIETGFTLIELMIAMLLGLVIISGVLGVVLMVWQTYRSNSALGQVQDSSRLAFEMLVHDIRNAQLTGCTNNGHLANALGNSTTTWWVNWNNALMGYASGTNDPAITTGSGANQRLGGASGSDSIQLLSAADSPLSVNTHSPTANIFQLNLPAGAAIGNTFPANAFVVVCDPDHAALLQITTSAGSTLGYTLNGAAGSPGNCTTNLSYPTSCNGGSSYTFGANAQIAPLSAVDWYLGTNTDGGTSLYRMTLTPGAASPSAQEMVRNVTSLSFNYLQSGITQFVPASQVTNWAGVTAVQVQLALQSFVVDAGSQPLARNYASTVALYNRLN